jgi:hypothetical protein
VDLPPSEDDRIARLPPSIAHVRIPASDFDSPGTSRALGMADIPLPYAKNFETAVLPNADRIEAAILSTI